MASNEATNVRNEPEAVQLTESDIPGAKLAILIDSYTMAELKWWLFAVASKSRTHGTRRNLFQGKMLYCTVIFS